MGANTIRFRAQESQAFALIHGCLVSVADYIGMDDGQSKSSTIYIPSHNSNILGELSTVVAACVAYPKIPIVSICFVIWSRLKVRGI